MRSSLAGFVDRLALWRGKLDIAEFAGRNTTVMMAGNIALILARLISTIVVTRILSAEDFGIAGIVFSVLYVIHMLSDIGVYAFVVNHDRADDPRFLDEVWTIRLLRGIAMAASLALLAWPLELFFAKPGLAPVIAVAGLSLALDHAGSMAFATAPRAGRLRRITIVDIVPTLASLPVTIALALWLQSYWAIIASLLVSGAIKTVLSYTLFPGSRRRWRPSWNRARELWAFGRFFTGSSLMQIVILQTDKIVLARLFSSGTFGLYSLAANLAQMPSALTGGYSARVLYPVFARTSREAPAAMSSAYYRAGLPLRLLYMAGAGAFVACAPLVVTLLYDDRYLGAVFFLQILSLALLVQLPVAVASDAIIASGVIRHILRLNAVRLGWLAVAALAFYPSLGPLGVIVAVVSAEGAAQIYSWVQLRKLGILRLAGELWFVLAACAGFAGGAAVNYAGLAVIS